MYVCDDLPPGFVQTNGIYASWPPLASDYFEMINIQGESHTFSALFLRCLVMVRHKYVSRHGFGIFYQRLPKERLSTE